MGSRESVRRTAMMAPVCIALAMSSADASAQRLTTELVTDVAVRPTWSGVAPGDATDRLFYTERSTGRVRILKNGVVNGISFLDISANLRARVDGGFLGMAFHPDYQNNGYFYVYYTDLTGDGLVERYTVSAGNPDVADVATRKEILRIERNPDIDLHAGGMIAFSPTDGYLYISHGDGGPQGDPDNNAQNLELLLGKILRIDVDGGDPYAIPQDNPFVNTPGARGEIWVYGLRNPWQGQFDPETGDIYLGDVGNLEWEEVDYIADGDGGHNFGWAIKEGTNCRNPPENCDPKGLLTDPIYEYAHTIDPLRCSVSGGRVYRGEKIPLLDGYYFFSDYCSSEILALRYDGQQIIDFQDRSAEVTKPDGTRLDAVVSFGLDAEGELLINDYLSGIYRIVTELQMDVPALVAGQPATIAAEGAPAGQPVAFVYSLRGTGETPVPGTDITLALRSPQLLGTAQADASGRASVTGNVPLAAQGRTLWLQAAWNETASDVARRVVE